MSAPAPAKTATTAPNHPVVPPVGFNFAASSWDESKRTKRNIAVVSAVGSVLFLFVFYLGFSASSRSSSAQDQIVSQSARQSQINSQIRSAAGGVSNLPGLIADRQRQVDLMLSNDVDVNAIVDALRAATPSNLVVQSVQIAKTSSVTGPSTTSGSRPAAPPAGTTYSVTLTAKTTDIDLPAAWQALASRSSALVNPVVDYTQTGPDLTVTLTAGVKDELALPRRGVSRTVIGEPPATTSKVAAPTTTSGSEGGLGG